MSNLSRRKYILSLSTAGLLSLAGCNQQRDPSIDEDTTEDPIPLPSVLERDSIPQEVINQHLETLSERQFKRTIVMEESKNTVRREYQRTSRRQYTEIQVNNSVLREIYQTTERRYVASYQNDTPRYSQQQSTLPTISSWGEQNEIAELLTSLNNVSLRELDTENEIYIYDGQTSPALDEPNVEVSITVNPIQITNIEVTESRAEEQVPRTYLIESGEGVIREPSWLTEAEQFSRSVVVGKRQGALFVYNEGSQALPSGSSITIIHPNGNVYTYQLEDPLPSESILFLEILQSGSVIGLQDSPPQSPVRLVLREEPYYLIGFGPNGEQYFDKSTAPAN